MSDGTYDRRREIEQAARELFDETTKIIEQGEVMERENQSTLNEVEAEELELKTEKGIASVLREIAKFLGSWKQPK